MLELPAQEMVIFIFVIVVYLATAILGILQLLAGGEKYKRFLWPLVSLAVTLEAVILVFRAVAIKAVPLTGLFESMIFLTIVFGLIYLFFSPAPIELRLMPHRCGTIRQVWFSSVMVWVIFGMILMAGVVARPASEVHAIAATPWAIAHAITMILGGASIMFAMATALLYLLGNHRLKLKKVMQVLDRVPNIEKLEQMTLVGIRAGFILITIGLISGLGLIWLLGTSILEWLTNGKVLCIIAAWGLLGIMLLLNRMFLLKGKVRAYMAIAVFVLILFAIILGSAQHDFTRY